MKDINKVTVYDYLKMKYDNTLVNKLFDRVGLDKTVEMPHEFKRGSGNTTLAVCEIVLTQLQTGVERSIYYGFTIVDGEKIRPDYETTSTTETKMVKHKIGEYLQLMVNKNA